MIRVNDIKDKYNLNTKKIIKKGKTIIIDTNERKIVIKEKNPELTDQLFRYLDSRSFNYYPQIVEFGDDYIVTEYVDDVDVPKEQKMSDLIQLVGLLHSKTTYFKEVDEANYKELYETITNNIEYLKSYYNDLASIIETKVYMSPSEYLLIRNISIIYGSLYFCEKEIERWYELVKNKRKQRVAVIHNNLDLSHFRKNKGAYLLSWDKTKADIPIFDLYKLYRRSFMEYDFSELLKQYEKGYPLLEEEKILLFILLSLPDKIEFNDTEYNMCRFISRKVDMLYKTNILISPYYAKEGK